MNTDRPHQFKMGGVYALPTHTTIAGVVRAASGIPITRQVNMISSLPVFYNGRLSDGRTPWLTVTDLSAAQDVPLPGGRVRGQVNLNVLNLFDQDAVTDVWRVETRENLPVPLETFFGGFDVQQRNLQHRRHPPRPPLPPAQGVAGSTRNTRRLQADFLAVARAAGRIAVEVNAGLSSPVGTTMPVRRNHHWRTGTTCARRVSRSTAVNGFTSTSSACKLRVAPLHRRKIAGDEDEPREQSPDAFHAGADGARRLRRRAFADRRSPGRA